MQTLLEIRNKTTEYFKKCDVPDPRFDAELILAHCLGMTRMQLYLNFDRPLQDIELDRMRPMVARRGKREPLQYIIGSTSFRGIEIQCDTRALIPRPETEVLVEHALQLLQGIENPHVLDVGTGTGAIAISIASSIPSAKVTAIDISLPALDLARVNIDNHHLQKQITLLHSDLLSNVPTDERFHMIISNPPYIPDRLKGTLQQEVEAFEPEMALFAASEGLAVALNLIHQSEKHLLSSGFLIMELGEGHCEALTSQVFPLQYQESRIDLQGVKRYPIFIHDKVVD